MSVQTLLAERLKEARELRSLSQSELAQVCKMPWCYIKEIEDGEWVPSFEAVRVIASYLKVRLDWLGGLTDSMDVQP